MRIHALTRSSSQTGDDVGGTDVAQTLSRLILSESIVEVLTGLCPPLASGVAMSPRSHDCHAKQWALQRDNRPWFFIDASGKQDRGVSA